jgi:pentatricopeptide repeat protein
MFSLPQNAFKVFEKITHRHMCFRNCIQCLNYSSFRNNHAYYEDPVDFYAQRENVISWTSKISGLVRKNQPNEAVGLFKKMLENEERPNYVTVLSVIRAVGALDCEGMIRVVHALVIKMGFESEVSVLTALLGCYSMYDMGIVWKLFYRIPSKDVVLWSAMVSACVRNGQYFEALEFFRDMQCHGVQPNHVSIVSVLPACADLGVLSLGKEIHGFSIKSVFYCLRNVQNSLVDMYAKCRNLEASIRVFKVIWKKDTISWRTIIRGCIENECPKKALSIFLKMRLSCFEPNETIIRDIVVASSQAEEHKFGLAFHCYILKGGFLAFVLVGTVLMQMYSKFGEESSARTIFDQLNHIDLIAWSVMISVYAQGRNPHNAFDTLKQMQSMNEKPNEITFVSLLQACSSIGSQELGESIHAHVIKAGYSMNAYLQSTLIDLYCKFGRIKQGKALFDEIPTKDLICWSSMIKGYGMNGCGTEALKTLSNMLDCGVKPNDIVFISVLSACGQCGLEYEGRSWFHSMAAKYGITPKLPHYACMVDLLSRRGKIEEALEFVRKMPVKPDKRIWGTLLACCRSTHGSIEIAEFVIEQLVALDPHNTSHYVFLSDLYAEHGRCEGVERLAKLMDEKELRKTLGAA